MIIFDIEVKGKNNKIDDIGAVNYLQTKRGQGYILI